MRFGEMCGRLAVAGIVLMAAAPFAAGSAGAKPRSAAGAHANTRAVYAGMAASHGYGRSFGYGRRSFSRYAGSSYAEGGYSGGGHLQCVPFARENTGIELSGNAANWWSAAQGVYERGAKPEVGSILNFRATGRMHMGHVAVVSNVVNARTVEIDQANWSGRGAVSHDTTVVDVSPDNDWTAVRVALGRTDTFGSIYPTYGFIYDRPDHGTMVANNASAPAPMLPAPMLNAAPQDLRPAADRMAVAAAPQETEEVAEAADDSDDTQPRFTRVGRHLIRVHSRGHGIPSHFASHLVREGRGFGPRPAQVVRIRGAEGPVSRSAAHRHGRT